MCAIPCGARRFGLQYAREEKHFEASNYIDVLDCSDACGFRSLGEFRAGLSSSFSSRSAPCRR